MLVKILFVWLVFDFCSAAIRSGPVAEFDTSSGITVNEGNEIEMWKDVRSSTSTSWSMSALSNKPLLVQSKIGRPHVHFSKDQRLLLNLSTPVYIDTGLTGSTLVIVLKNEYRRSHMIFGGIGNSVNAHIRFDNPTTIRLTPPTNMFPIHNSMDAFHSYVIRSSSHVIEIFQDGVLVATKRTDHAYGKDKTMMHCFGCWFSKHFFQGRVSYLSFYKYAVDSEELSTLHEKLKEVTVESNLGMTQDDIPTSSSSSGPRPPHVSPANIKPYASAPNSNMATISLVPTLPTITTKAKVMQPQSPPSSSKDSLVDSSDQLMRSVNGSLVISTHSLHNMLHRHTGNGSFVLPSDTIHAAVTGLFVIAACCLIPWCVLLVCCLRNIFTSSSSSSSSSSYPPLPPPRDAHLVRSHQHQHPRHRSAHRQHNYSPVGSTPDTTSSVQQQNQNTRAWRRPKNTSQIETA